MSRKTLALLVIFSVLIMAGGCNLSLEEISFEPGIERKPGPQNLSSRSSQPLQELPSYNSSIRSKPDLRGHDLTALDLTGELELLLNSSFNTTTRWPENLPEDFDPVTIMELNKSPGLGLRSLHEQGITGAGVGVAVIDYALLVDHVEYKENLKMYREVNYDDYSPAEFHGSGMASILAGQTTGVAPGADLYFIAVRNMDMGKDELIHNQNYTAQAIRGLIRFNETLPDTDKIRVISISQWWSPHTKGYKNMLKAVDEARAAGIFVVSCNLWQYNSSFHIHGLLKDPLADPEEFESYRPAAQKHWLTAVNRNGHGDFYEQEFSTIDVKKVLLLPSAYTVSAGAEHSEDYIYNPEVNWSNTIPYIAGLYALACLI